jgi:N-acetylglutamate synthase
MNLEYSEFNMNDYGEAIALWHSSEGIGLSAADSPVRIATYLARNPGLSFVARVGETLVGAVLCGHDGRRGYLHHLAVDPVWRGKGIGQTLVKHCLSALSAHGIDKCHIFVIASNQSGRDFWQKIGWKERPEIVLMSRET